MNSACQSCVSVDGHAGQYLSQQDYGWRGQRDNTDNAIVALFWASHVSDLPNFNKVTFLRFAVTVNRVGNRKLSAFQ